MLFAQIGSCIPLPAPGLWQMACPHFHRPAGTFTVVHHTAPHIPFKPASEWNAAKAQLSGTVHCDYPRVRAGVALGFQQLSRPAGRAGAVLHVPTISRTTPDGRC